MDEAFRLAVCSRRIWFGADVACLNPSTGLCEGGGFVTAAIVDHNPFYADAALAEPADGAIADP